MPHSCPSLTSEADSWNLLRLLRCPSKRVSSARLTRTLNFVRTVPLKVGETYTYQRYFKAEKNPVIVKVLRLDTVTVKAGKFPCIVIQPIIKSGGIFAEGGEALMWLSDDDKRMLVQMKTKVPILKSLDLYLKSVTMVVPATDSAAATP